MAVEKLVSAFYARKKCSETKSHLMVNQYVVHECAKCLQTQNDTHTHTHTHKSANLSTNLRLSIWYMRTVADVDLLPT